MSSNIQATEITVNGVVYIPKSAAAQSATFPAVDTAGLPAVLVRTNTAGVHYGYLKAREGREVTLVNSRRIWSWVGACSLSQIAVEGVKNGRDSKISVPVPTITLTEAIEVIPLTAPALTNLDAVPQWRS